MRELRSSTVKARESDQSPPTGGKRRQTRSAQKSPKSQESKESSSGRNWKTRGRISGAVKAKKNKMVDETSSDESSADESPPCSPPKLTKEIDEPAGQNAEDTKEKNSPMATPKLKKEVMEESTTSSTKASAAITVNPKKETKESSGDESSVDKENGSIKKEEPESGADSGTKYPQRKRSVASYAGLEEEAEDESDDEDSHSSVSSPDVAKKRRRGKNGEPIKPRILYDPEKVKKAVEAVLEERMTVKKAAEEFGISRGAVTHRLRGMRPIVQKDLTPKLEIHIIRVEDLD